MRAPLRCRGCNRRGGFPDQHFRQRSRGDNSKPRLERVVAWGNNEEAWRLWEERSRGLACFSLRLSPIVSLLGSSPDLLSRWTFVRGFFFAAILAMYHATE